MFRPQFDLKKNEQLGIGSFTVTETDKEKLDLAGAGANAVALNSKKKLGAGGFAQVFEGSLNGKLVAVKKIKISRSLSDQQELLHNEIEIQAQLDHENVIKLFGTSEVQGEFFYLVLEFSQGRDLFDILYTDNIPLNPSELLTITTNIVAGLCYLHGMGFLHRDIKAENILLDFARGARRAKIADFGFAIKTADAKGRNLCGSTMYLAPELMAALITSRKGVFTPWTDVYALGLTVLEMIRREQPLFNEHNLKDRVDGKVHPIPEWTPDELKSVINGCLKKDPLQRFDTKQLKELLVGNASVFESQGSRLLSQLPGVELAGKSSTPVLNRHMLFNGSFQEPKVDAPSKANTEVAGQQCVA